MKCEEARYSTNLCAELRRILLPGAFREHHIQLLQDARKTAREDAAKKRRDLPEGDGMRRIYIFIIVTRLKWRLSGDPPLKKCLLKSR